MFRQGQLAVHGLASLLGRNEAGISNRGKFILHHAVSPRFSSKLYSMHYPKIGKLLPGRAPTSKGVRLRQEQHRFRRSFVGMNMYFLQDLAAEKGAILGVIPKKWFYFCARL